MTGQAEGLGHRAEIDTFVTNPDCARYGWGGRREQLAAMYSGPYRLTGLLEGTGWSVGPLYADFGFGGGLPGCTAADRVRDNGDELRVVAMRNA